MEAAAARQQAAFDALITAVLARFASGTSAEVSRHIEQACGKSPSSLAWITRS